MRQLQITAPAAKPLTNTCAIDARPGEAPSSSIGAEFGLIDCSLRERSSNIGPINMGPLISGMINGIVLPVMIPLINEAAAALWVVPQMAGLSLVNAALPMRNDVVAVAADALYAPDGRPVESLATPPPT